MKGPFPRPRARHSPVPMAHLATVAGMGRQAPEGYPWRCLWRGFSQMIRTTPFRRMILHLSQIFFTEALTFILSRPFQPVTWPGM